MVLSLSLFGIYDLEISYNWGIIEVWKIYGYSWRYGKSSYLFKFDTCQIKKNVHIWASSSCNVDLEALSLSRNSWQYDGYFSALAFFVCAIIVFIILLVVIW